MKGRIFNIQHFSLHDGPGIRTTVFFKGCPMKCLWCHNPESISGSVQTVLDRKKCIGCGSCHGNVDEDSAGNCPSSAIEVIGKEVTAEEVMEEILSDKEFYKSSGGGVTFSGGEPLLQPEFLRELLKKCAENDINTTIDTCGLAQEEDIKSINELAELYLYDIKLIDEKLHRKYTGVSNRLTLSNLKYLSECGKRIFIRIPLIPGITDTQMNIDEIKRFLAEINFEQINLLSYHSYAESKYIKLGLEFGMKGIVNNSSKTEEIADEFIRSGFKVFVGG